MVSLERGHDPRRFTLFAFGGAGPLHAAAVARAMRIPRVLVPLYPGNASAMGMLLADLRVDKVWTQAFRSTAVDAALVERQFARIREAAVAELRDEGFAGEPEVSYAIAMRYLGQNYEHEVPIPAAAVHRRYGLAPGTRLAGPCVVEEAGSTTVVEPGMAAAVLPDGQLLIEVNP